ncbi:MAG: amidohydrolase family protein, partial [Geminicoccaceae bacterium]
PPVKGVPEHFIAIEQRLKEMDAMAIDMEVLSINPFWYEKDRDLGEKIVSIQNEKLAALVATKPDRFAAFASLTMQDPALAAQQLETAMKKQGLKGAAIGDRVGGNEFSNPKFDPVWKKAEELGAVLFIHPQGVPELNARLKGNGWLANTMGWAVSTWFDRPAHIQAMRQRAMQQDNSWDRAAAAYEDLYLRAYERRRGHPFPG